MFIAEGRPDDAVRDFSTAVELIPEAARPRILLASLLKELGRDEEARAVLQDVRMRASAEERSLRSDPLKSPLTRTTHQIRHSRRRKGRSRLLSGARSNELEEAVRQTPLLSDPGFLEALENYCRELAGWRRSEGLRTASPLPAANPLQPRLARVRMANVLL